tara:strand:- start:164 stop:373 length:210 start_codon:yes stop_codon:yes gene_type:complete
MKLLLTALLLTISTLGMANEATLTSSESTQIEASIASDKGKGKKARRNKRANRKRKRRCAKSAHRNFAG